MYTSVNVLAEPRVFRYQAAEVDFDQPYLDFVTILKNITQEVQDSDMVEFLEELKLHMAITSYV